MNLNQLDIIVSDVTQVCANLERILDKKADYVDDSFAPVHDWQSLSHVVSKSFGSFGKLSVRIILHIEVGCRPELQTVEKELGIQVLNGPVVTDWGTETLVKGPAEV